MCVCMHTFSQVIHVVCVCSARCETIRPNRSSDPIYYYYHYLCVAVCVCVCGSVIFFHNIYKSVC